MAARLGLLFLVGGLLALSACNRNSPAAAEERRVPLHPDAPLVLQVNTKGQVRFGDRWYHLINEEGQVQSLLDRQAQEYQQMLKEYRLDLVPVREGSRVLQAMPVKVIIEVEPGTKGAYVYRLQRFCKGHGFWFFELSGPGQTYYGG